MFISIILAYFPYFVKIKVRLWDRLAVCVYIPLLNLNAWTSLYETRYVNRSTWSHLLPPISLCVCTSMCIPLSLLGNDTVPYQRIQARNVGSFDLYSVRVVSKESLWVCLVNPLLLLSNGTVNTFPRHRIIVGSVDFHIDPFRVKEK
jgi:hypothetical protein